MSTTATRSKDATTDARVAQVDLKLEVITGRPSVVDLWHDLRAVTSEIRPDWDLSTPGLREAWDAGDLSPFHGWNKRPGQRPATALTEEEP